MDQSARLIPRDHLVVAFGLAGLTLLSWMYLWRMAGDMHMAAMDAEMHAAMGMPEMGAWDVADVILLFLMWTVMMVAMMVPSASPLVLLIVGVYRRRGGRARLNTAAFVGGYLAVWTGFSLVAALLQALLHDQAMLTPEMAARSVWAAGSLFVAAGVYQWLPIKGACLTHCRSPLHFLAHEWREGLSGALAMGVRHGAFCVGCCWALMALLFAAGVMNLFWVAAIAGFVLVEKLLPRADLVSRVGGVALMAWGVYLFSQA